MNFKDRLRAAALPVWSFAGFVAVWVICVVVWGLTGQGYFWPMWPALGFVIGTIYAGVRIFRMPKE